MTGSRRGEVGEFVPGSEEARGRVVVENGKQLTSMYGREPRACADPIRSAARLCPELEELFSELDSATPAPADLQRSETRSNTRSK
jgi:hypothetical protein